jgi:hypothetical protein
MNLSDLPITIISQRAKTAVVQPYGFPMECEYEYDEGEAPIYWPTELAHPGCPPNAELMACRVGGVDIYEMLKHEQIERIEDAILSQLEG